MAVARDLRGAGLPLGIIFVNTSTEPTVFKYSLSFSLVGIKSCSIQQVYIFISLFQENGFVRCVRNISINVYYSEK